MIGTIRNLISLNKGLREFDSRGITPRSAYLAMRQLYVVSNGRTNDFLSNRISRQHPPQEISGQSILSKDEVQRATTNLSENGFHVFETKLPADTVKRIVDFGSTTPCRALHAIDPKIQKFEYAQDKQIYDTNAATPKLNFDIQDLFDESAIQELMMDSGFRTIAQDFLRCSPILDLVAMWWSNFYGGKAHSSAAQLYHFDMDRIKFVKFFFYLTDVTERTGPHCYIAGSSKRKPRHLLRDGRISDDEISQSYSEDRIHELCGSAGTILAVDTRGFHKGKALLENNRLLLQFEFANSLFGQEAPVVESNPDWSREFKTFVKDQSRLMQIVHNI